MFDFQRTTGVVAKITNQDGSKSAKLAEALSGAKKIVVCTIQTFPHAMEAVRELSDARGQRAVTRRPPQGMMLPEAHDKAREWALISALSASAVPVAPALGFCEDTSVTGTHEA